MRTRNVAHANYYGRVKFADTEKALNKATSLFTARNTVRVGTHRMIKLRHLLSLLVCAVVFLGANDAAEEAGSDEGSKSEDVCYQPELSQYGDLFREAFAVSLGEDVQVYINCMSFGENGELETAVVSGRNESGNETGVFTFKCGGSALIAFESERTFSKMETESCLECDTSSTTGDACVTRKLEPQCAGKV